MWGLDAEHWAWALLMYACSKGKIEQLGKSIAKYPKKKYKGLKRVSKAERKFVFSLTN